MPARLACGRPWLLLAVTGVLLVLAAVLGGGVTEQLRHGGGEDPAAESSRAARLLERNFPRSRPDLVLMATAEQGVDHPLAVRRGRALTDRLTSERGVLAVTSYWTTRAKSLRADNGREALIVARLTGDEGDAVRAWERIAPRYRGDHGVLRVRAGGTAGIRHVIQTTISEDLVRAEQIALPVTLLILVFVFRSAVAALLPVCIGAIAIVGTNAVLRALAAITEVSVFALNITTALGLGLSIDYALLIVRRYREELADGKDIRAAIFVTLQTAGRTVLFSAATVAVSLSAMLNFPLYFLRSMAYAGVSVVALSTVAALVVLPALLTVLGPRINALDARTLVCRPSGRHAAPRYMREWTRLTNQVMRRAPFFAVGTVAFLILLGMPFLGVRFGTSDDRQLPPGVEARIVQQQIRDDFTENGASGIDLITQRADVADLTQFSRQLSKLDGVKRVDGPTGQYSHGSRFGPGDRSRTSGTTSWLTVVPTADPASKESEDLVRAIRGMRVQFPAYATGIAAVSVDSQAAIGTRLPRAAIFIAMATLSLVLLLTRSVLVSLQAVVLNALSLTAMFGAVVWVFQDGHLSGLLGFTPTGSIDALLPVLMFCVAFGLSMDYGVFLLSRIREEFLRTGDHREAVLEGMRRTGGVITAAAVILAVVLASVGTSRTTNTKMLGLGVALAVLVDALVVRTLLVPAVLALTGRAAWRFPVPPRRPPEIGGRAAARQTRIPAPDPPTSLNRPEQSPKVRNS
nr:MMPL family transporter [Streptomyces halobius]